MQETPHLPACRADLIRVVLHVLDGLQHAERLVHAAAKCQVVYRRVLDDALSQDRRRNAKVLNPQNLVGKPQSDKGPCHVTVAGSSLRTPSPCCQAGPLVL